jgi:hypothetical protein
MKRTLFAWLVALALTVGVAAAGPCWASTVVPEVVTLPVYLSSSEAGTVMPVTDATFQAEVLRHPGLVLAEFWAPW